METLFDFFLGMLVGCFVWPIPCIIIVLLGRLIVGILYGPLHKNNNC